MKAPNITPQNFSELRGLGRSRKLLDVRTPAEYRSLHAEGATSLPLDAMDATAMLSSGTLRMDEPVAVICASGGRSAVAGAKLTAAGFTDVVNIDGGTRAWEKAGLPVVRGKPSVSLERQVRVTAGSLVVIGLATGWFITPWMFLLPGFVGGGLVFSGLTNTCGMGSILRRMPWNRQ